MVTELLTVFLAAGGLILLLWAIMGLLLTPVFSHDMITLCFSDGCGDDLERKAKSYGWLREGRLSGGRMVIVDCGLDAEGLQLALCLRERYDWVDYCPRLALMDYIEMEKQEDEE